MHFSYYDGPATNNPEEGCMPVKLITREDLIPAANTHVTADGETNYAETVKFWADRTGLRRGW